jgi:hypothetical protein
MHYGESNTTKHQERSEVLRVGWADPVAFVASGILLLNDADIN